MIWKSITKYVIMSEESISQKFRLKNLNGARNYFLEEIKQN